jgi:uncharacterized repeat protein (TIGR03803 family)
MISCLTLAMLTGAAIVISSPASASSYAVVYSFTGGGSGDGADPVAGLLSVPGTSGAKLYGTTAFGGTAGRGTVFTLNPASSVEAVVHSFTGSDGVQPSAALINVGGTLYGTTGFGGAACFPDGCGTVFKLDPATGVVTVVHSFAPGTGDGGYPFASLTNVGGKLYGTTQYGGASKKGTVFSYDPATGTETIEYSFAGGSDGMEPLSGLTKLNGLLYGTTVNGGTAGDGTVFAFDPATGAESVVYTLLGGSDGAHPLAGVSNVSGKLYGAANRGGGTGTGCGGSGCGVVFSVDPATGGETIVHTFTGGDGANPGASLIDIGGTLYGTTLSGGISLMGTGHGTIYSIDVATGTETLLHSFGLGSDGQNPRTTLIDVSGVLYGTTMRGGASGFGTVFGYTP